MCCNRDIEKRYDNKTHKGMHLVSDGYLNQLNVVICKVTAGWVIDSIFSGYPPGEQGS